MVALVRLCPSAFGDSYVVVTVNRLLVIYGMLINSSVDASQSRQGHPRFAQESTNLSGQIDEAGDARTMGSSEIKRETAPILQPVHIY